MQCAARSFRRSYCSDVSHRYLTVLVAVAVVILATRLVIPSLPLHRYATRLRPIDAVCIAIGVVGLVFHCGAMFYRPDIARLPGTHSAIRAIDAMGTASRVWFIAPAILVVAGLRRQHPIALGAVAAALAVVGLTMYDQGRLRTHLNAIFVAAVVIAAVMATLVLRPLRHRPKVEAQ